VTGAATGIGVSLAMALALEGALSPTPFEQVTPEDWAPVMTVNTIAPFLCSRAVAPRMRERKWSRIVNLISAAGRMLVWAPMPVSVMG
jgi:NAD(P)-dependent dehydrogenase (short-subunit alcohol dehydrogenase family)